MRRQEREEEEEEGKGNKSFTRSNDGQGIRMTRGRVILKKVFKKREGTVPPSFSLRFIMKGCNSRKYPYWDSSLNPWLAGRLRLKKGETKGIFLFLLLFPPFIQEQERCLSSGPPFKKKCRSVPRLPPPTFSPRPHSYNTHFPSSSARIFCHEERAEKRNTACIL